MSESSDSQWYSVRCIFQLDTDDDEFAYEERLTLWKAQSSDEAIALAEAEAAEYVVAIDAKYIKLAQSFQLFDPPGHSREVYSLTRESALPPDEYLDAFFATGREITRHWREPGGDS
jgi:hypothetical protein